MHGLRLIFAIGLIVVLLALVFQPDLRDELTKAIVALSLIDIVLVALLFLLMRAVQAIVLLRLLALRGRRIAFTASMNLAALKGLFNLMFFGLGLAAQSAQARLDFYVPVKAMLFANLTQSFMLVLALGTSLFVATIFFFSNASLPAPAAFLFVGLAAGALGLAGSVGCLYPGCLPAGLRQSRFSHWLVLPESGLKVGGIPALNLVVLEFAVVVLRVARILIIAYVIDPGVDLGLLLITVLGADTLGVVSITPGGIGVRELIIASMGAVAEHYEIFLAAAVIDRMLTIAFNVAHGAFAVWTSGRGRNIVQ